MFKTTKIVHKLVSNVRSSLKEMAADVEKSLDQRMADLEKMTDDLTTSVEEIAADVDREIDGDSTFDQTVTQIQTILSSDPADFDERVNAALKTGWKLHETQLAHQRYVALMYKSKVSN